MQADTLCVNAETNTQTFNNSGNLQTLEEKNPSEVCWSNDGSAKKITTHGRRASLGSLLYTIIADGCGSADNDGTHFGICPAGHLETF